MHASPRLAYHFPASHEAGCRAQPGGAVWGKADLGG